jgi:hypothetical protein
MAVAYIGAEAIVLRDVAAWLVASAAFRAFVGTDSPTVAGERLVEIEGAPLDVAHAVIDTPVLRVVRTPGGDHDAACDVSIVFASPITAGDNDAEVHRRALNALSAIRREILDEAGQIVQAVTADPPGILDASDGLSSWVEFMLTFTVEARP